MPEPRAQAIAARLDEVRGNIREWCLHYGRDPAEVTLLAVSKAFPAADIEAAAAAGQRLFGESYLNEALEKMERLAHLRLGWHFIGPIQSNKTRRLAEHFDWIQSLDRLKIARRLNEQRPEGLPPINVLLQVNISGEASKAGLEPGALPETAEAVQSLPRLKLRGLMAIPARTSRFGEQRAAFARLRELYEALREQGMPLDTLSMGMSGDLEAAIAEGSTLVRVGTGIFGPRPPRGGHR